MTYCSIVSLTAGTSCCSRKHLASSTSCCSLWYLTGTQESTLSTAPPAAPESTLSLAPPSAPGVTLLPAPPCCSGYNFVSTACFSREYFVWVLVAGSPVYHHCYCSCTSSCAPLSCHVPCPVLVFWAFPVHCSTSVPYIFSVSCSALTLSSQLSVQSLVTGISSLLTQCLWYSIQTPPSHVSSVLFHVPI